MSALESPHKKMKMTMNSYDLVHVHLDHHIGSSLLKQKIQSNPFVLKSLTRVESFAIDTRLQDAEIIGFCEKYGLIFSKEDSIYVMKNGQVTLELRDLFQLVNDLMDEFVIQEACIELGKENDYIYVLCDFSMFKLELNGNCVWVIDDLGGGIYNLVYDAKSKQIIYRDENQKVFFRNSETGELIYYIGIPHLRGLCLGPDNQLFVLCGTSTSPSKIMIFYGEKYSQSRTLAVLDGFWYDFNMKIWNDRLALINKNTKNHHDQALIYVDTKTGKIEDIYNFRTIHFSKYYLFGKHLIRSSFKSVKEVSVFELRPHSEHFDSVWSKEVHNLMKTLNIDFTISKMWWISW